MAQHNKLGKRGEDIAVAHLQHRHYQILERNYRYNKAEIDIIALKDDNIIAVEVKTRSTPEFGNPQGFVKPKQIQRLVMALDHYISTKGLDYEARFDIIGIIQNKSGTHLEHLKDAFLHF